MDSLKLLIKQFNEKINSKALALDDNKVIINWEALEQFLQTQPHLDSLLKVIKLLNTNKSIFDNEKILLDLFTFDKKIFDDDNIKKSNYRCRIIYIQIADRLYNLKNQIESTYPDLITNQKMCRN